MSATALIGACAVGVGAAGLAGLVVPPARRLGPRVRPYAVVARTALGHAPDPLAHATQDRARTATLPHLFGPPIRAAAARLGRAFEPRGDEQLARVLRQAGMADVEPDDFRIRRVLEASVVGALCGIVLGGLARAPFVGLLAAAAGFVVGLTRRRRRVERAIDARAARIRLELYTINHLLAMHVRTGAGPMQAVQRVVDRGRGVVVGELADILAWTRHGMHEAEAFRHAADLTPEPSAARTYLVLAAGVERGVDLGASLLGLSEDIRDARREQLHKDAVRRRAAMLVPTIAILAPIMLLFIAAPLPSIVLGHR